MPRKERKADHPKGMVYDLASARSRAAARRELKRLAREQEAACGAPPPSVQELLAELLPPRRAIGEVGWTRCEKLLAVSWELRHDDPAGMLFFADVAAGLAQAIDPATRGPRALADLQCRAFAALANARRVSGDLRTAEIGLARALERFDEGTRDLGLLARLMDLAGSLFVDQRRFAEAESVLAWSCEVYRSRGENQLAGKSLLQRGIAAGYAGEAARAVDLLIESLTLLDPEAAPQTLLACLHGLATFQVDCGQFSEASAILWKARPLYAAYGGALDKLRAIGVEGRIAAGLGHPGRAERCFRQARTGFYARNAPYPAAIASLDLAMVLLERGSTAEARALVEQTVETFEALNIPREAAGALLLLGEAARQDRLTETILKAAAGALQQLQP